MLLVIVTIFPFSSRDADRRAVRRQRRERGGAAVGERGIAVRWRHARRGKHVDGWVGACVEARGERRRGRAIDAALRGRAIDATLRGRLGLAGHGLGRQPGK